MNAIDQGPMKFKDFYFDRHAFLAQQKKQKEQQKRMKEEQ